MKKLLSLGLATTLLLESGCGALVFHNPEAVIVTCNVPGASVTASGEAASCVAPGTLRLDRTRDHVIVVSAPGYASQNVRIESSPSWWRILFSVVLNGAHGLFTLFISTAIGLAIDLGAGAWQALDQDEVYVGLERDGFDAPATTGLHPAPVRPGEVTPLAPDMGAATVPAPLPPDAQAGSAAKDACSNCGSRIAPGAHFCSNCGERLP